MFTATKSASEESLNIRSEAFEDEAAVPFTIVGPPTLVIPARIDNPFPSGISSQFGRFFPRLRFLINRGTTGSKPQASCQSN
jgi:hypothetical protein